MTPVFLIIENNALFSYGFLRNLYGDIQINANAFGGQTSVARQIRLHFCPFLDGAIYQTGAHACLKIKGFLGNCYAHRSLCGSVIHDKLSMFYAQSGAFLKKHPAFFRNILQMKNKCKTPLPKAIAGIEWINAVVAWHGICVFLDAYAMIERRYSLALRFFPHVGKVRLC